MRRGIRSCVRSGLGVTPSRSERISFRRSRRYRRTPVYLPTQVLADMKDTLGTWEHLRFLETQGLIRIQEVPDGESFEQQHHEVRPFRLAEGLPVSFAHDTLVVDV